MSDKTKIRFAFLALLLVIVGLCVGYSARNVIMRQYDAARLARFAHRIADTDRIVGTWEHSPVHLTLTGDDARKVVRAVSSAASARLPNAELACMYSAKAIFYRGTNVLGHIEMCNSLFLLKFSQPPFVDSSGLLDTAIYTPVLEALRQSYRTNGETK
jgi:hypothetical protein